MRTLLLFLAALPFMLYGQSSAPSFAAAKGTLPVPITGQYRLLSGFGTHVVAGLEMGSSGVYVRGKGSCHARAVYEGSVTAVYQFDSGYCVVLRHGSYLTVYACLEDTDVKQGQRVKALATIGRVGRSGGDERVLHFQVRHEREPLNPALWVKF